MNSSDTSDREMVIERVFDAPRELVYRAWTEPEHLAKWWGPEGMSVVTTEHNFTVGGLWRFEMGPSGGGGGMPMKSIYREIVPFERIVTEDTMEKIEGQSTPEDMMIVTAIFLDQGEKNQVDAAHLARLSRTSKEKRRSRNPVWLGLQFRLPRQVPRRNGGSGQFVEYCAELVAMPGCRHDSVPMMQ